MSKSYVTMEQKLCPICGTKHDTDALLLDTRMRDKFEMKTVSGYGLCKECQSKRDNEYIALVVCDETKSNIAGDTLKMENAYRTGEIFHIKKEAAKQIFNKVKDIAKRDMVFIDSKLAKQLKERMEE